MRQLAHFIDGAAASGGARADGAYDPDTRELQARVVFADAAGPPVDWTLNIPTMQ